MAPRSHLTATVRMYKVGFGDAFVVTIHNGAQQWRMLVDCGVHAHGVARPIEETVTAIIADLTADTRGGPPHLDVVAATHHHADHITGFASDQWEQVEVGEVWVPFVEDPHDADAKALRAAQTEVAQRLTALIEHRLARPAGAGSPLLAQARDFAANSAGNDVATDRLLGRNGRHFANGPPVRFLPSLHANENTIALDAAGAVVHVLGPSRDPQQLKRMDPPAKVAWLALDPALDPLAPGRAARPLFDPQRFVMPESALALPQFAHLRQAHQALRHLDRLDDDALLAAAAALEECVNNTSLFLVLDVGGRHLLFPGDTQQGGWEHVLDDDSARPLVADACFYKIAHHGSGNATPRRFVEEVLRDGADAMLPWSLVEQWKDTIPAHHLLDALAAHHHTITRADAPVAIDGKVTVDADGWWSELTVDCGPLARPRPPRRRTVGIAAPVEIG